MAGETEVVVGAEHEDALAVDLRLRAVIVVERLKEGIYLALTRLVRERKLVGLGEDIAAVLAIVAVRQHGLDGHVWWQFGEGDRGRLAVLFASSSLGHICVHYSIEKRGAKCAARGVKQGNRLSGRGVRPERGSAATGSRRSLEAASGSASRQRQAGSPSRRTSALVYPLGRPR